MIKLSGGVLDDGLRSLAGCSETWCGIIEYVMSRDIERYKALDTILTNEYANTLINPEKDNIFRAFRDCTFENTKAVICGQDPYPNHEHAVGLSFSVPAGAKLPPSLKNIYKELSDDIPNTAHEQNGDISHWAKSGVLMLNTTLTVEAGKSNSHKKLWNGFAVEVLTELSRRKTSPLAFILWGSDAHAIGKVMEKTAPQGAPRKYVYSVHPSPLSAYRGFFGSKPFSEVNRFLNENGEAAIDW